MTNRTALRVLLAMACLALAPVARAGGFSTTNIQLLQGYNFDDNWIGHPEHGNITTLTLNTFSTWEYGDSFAFADLMRREDAGAETSSVYLEWHPRLFVNQLLGQKEPLFGVIRNWGLAGEVNQGNNFYAYMGGVGFDFVAPKFWVLGVNLYYRYDQYAHQQWQISPFWTVPFAVGPVPFVFTGFVDINGTKSFTGKQGVEIWAQPELLVDVLGAAGGAKNKLLVGTEIYIHRGYATIGDPNKIVNTAVPQAMVQWNIF
jgi:nucleoside-specific outer membrane channel protein Tsx